MKPKTTTLALALTAAVASTAGWAQDPPPAPPAAPVAAPPPAPEAGWAALSRSSERVYLVNMSKVRREGDVIAVPVARTRLNRADPADFSYATDEIELKCAAGQSRATTTIEYDSDDVEIERYDDPSPWGPIAPDTLDDFVKTIACEDNVLTGRTWPTVRAFIEAGQPAANAQ